MKRDNAKKNEIKVCNRDIQYRARKLFLKYSIFGTCCREIVLKAPFCVSWSDFCL